ncbi:helix-turn-helix transcriptional regulator [Streptomyces sp. JJ66]|uniref:helix-turn-helix domain-containing protein n=1 Tax=Streptomyces sp. JJ66 TaxID=2803843 RepID=UPI001C572E5D|nr:helix-turn-helix transcriptional regulator [Streptomyces sp. JJ66]MBW1604526.1 helix-turn-helix transcriptional regulator [Streptomyces sp. JJ66]
MSSSPLSSAHVARSAVAIRLLGMMKDAGLTGHDIAQRCGWHKSKSSRIAQGKTMPSDADIRAWCTACGAEDQIADLVAASRNAEAMYVQWKQLHRSGMRNVHERTLPLYQRTRRFRVYASNVLPGMFQTRAYATGLLHAIRDFQETPDDVRQAVEARLARSRVVGEGGRSFALLVEEAVLYYRVADDAAMSEQLHCLMHAASQPNVSLGVVPLTARRTVWPLEAFYAFDDVQVAVETLTAEINVSSPGEVRTYLRAFARLSQAAVYGAQAQALVRRALASLD